MAEKSFMGLYGLAVMGQNFALNVAEKGFRISVCNRSPGRVDDCVKRAADEGLADKLTGFKDPKEFVDSLEKPRRIMFLVKAGKPVDSTIDLFKDLLEEGDILIDGGNEWFENSIRRADSLRDKKIMYLAMGVSGGEEGARNGPSLMPGGPKAAYDIMEPLLLKVAAQTDSGPCVTYLGGDGAGNYVKMVHNGIEYGDMQLICEAYDVMKRAGLTNDELSSVFAEWNNNELQSFLVEITSIIFSKKDQDVINWADDSSLPADESNYLVDKIVDRTGNKGTGRMTVMEAATRSVAAPTIASALDARYMSAIKEDRIKAEKILSGPNEFPAIDRTQLIDDVRAALYASKICSYAQGMNILRQASIENDWNLNLGECARIWKGGCIIRAKFLDRIKSAYDRDGELPNLMLDPEFASEIMQRQPSWRRIVALGAAAGIALPSMSASLCYFDTFRRGRLSANLVQAQRDFFGSHTFERTDKPKGEMYHCKWTDKHA